MVCHSSLECRSTFCGKYLPPHMASNSGNFPQHSAHQANSRENCQTSSIRKGHVLENYKCEDNSICQTKDVNSVSKVKCYVCDSRVERHNLSKHLFFGKIKCRDCGLKFNDCESFYPSFKSSMCAHKNVVWSKTKSKTPIEFLEENLGKKYKDKNHEVFRYAKKLEDLKHKSPWKVVLCEIRNRKSSETKKHSPEKHKLSVNICKKKLPENNSNKCNNISYPETTSSNRVSHLSIEKQVKSKSDSLKRKRASTSEQFGNDSKPNNNLDKMVFGKSKIEPTAETTVEYLDLPTDGKYLIIQKSIEECPMCYSKVKIKNCIVNVSLLFYKFFCECGVKIFFIPKTPANIEHPVTILNTSTLVKKTTTKHLQKRKKKEMKIKTTSDLLR